MKNYVKKITNEYGTIRYYNKKGQFHRTDGPAVEYSNGNKCWFINGEKHRTDGPAFEYLNGEKWWFVNGKLHREDGPAVEYTSGDMEWYLYYRCYTHKKEEFLYQTKYKESYKFKL